MGKKINPRVFRLRTTTTHMSKWYANKQDFGKFLREDVSIRRELKNKFKDSSVSRIEIKRSSGQMDININTAKPGMIIGKGGAGIEEVKKKLKQKYFGSEKIKININIQEIQKPDLDAEIVVNSINTQLEKRIPFRRVMKRTIDQVKRAGARGVKIVLAGRLNGVEIARTETLVDGSVPAQTLRADIDYARGTAHTIYGTIGVKVWIYKGIVFEKDKAKKNIKPPKKVGAKPKPKETKDSQEKTKQVVKKKK